MKTKLVVPAWFLFMLIFCSSSKSSQNSGVARTTPDIVGVWAFVSNVGGSVSTDRKVKIIYDKHWMFSQADPKTHLTLFHHGGSYVLNGNRYAETIEYANESTGGLLGQTFEYEVSVTSDTMVLKGPFNEVWERVK